MKHGDIELVVSRFFAESWWAGQSGKKKAQESSRVTTDQPRTSWKLIGNQILSIKPKLRISEKILLHRINEIYLPVLSESCLQHVYCSIGRHGQRQSFLSDDKVLCQPSVNKAILGEFQSKMIVSWQQYGNENLLAFISVDFGLSTWNFACEFLLTLPISWKKIYGNPKESL